MLDVKRRGRIAQARDVPGRLLRHAVAAMMRTVSRGRLAELRYPTSVSPNPYDAVVEIKSGVQCRVHGEPLRVLDGWESITYLVSQEAA
ncbi:hypothetical protein [Chitiniphilus eburneus]|uniref:Uncharacterized protein n=1 Tax=Chitiniphilus eburneus TaxID=2571148 RepID=A0A4U0PXA6_9NEIS|nr:hypothetical protein [Chitiniphilus eburneus]TJZ73185.1 hypothetical protein FAZ21_11245 [Chitiniphilus eburneus]